MDINTQQYLNKFELRPKLEFEYQQLCQENEKLFGKWIWSIPWRKEVKSDAHLRDAIKIAKDRKNYSYPYLIGILRKLK